MALGFAEIRTFPDGIFNEYRSDSVGVVHIVADFAVASLELLYRFNVFEPGDSFFQF